MNYKPSHYENLKLDPLEIMFNNFTKEEYVGFLKGNILKYLLRFESKGGVDDLLKCKSYLNMLIAVEKIGEESNE